MRKERCFIVGGGPSLVDFDFLQLVDEDTIVVNKSILHVPFPNYFITVDYTFSKKIGRECFRQIDTTKMFVADFSHPSLIEKNGKIVDIKYGLTYDNLEDFNKVIKSHRSDGIGYTFDDFRTGRNSGFCALQLAVILGYKEIYLLGIDLNQSNQTHYHGGYGEKSEVFSSRLEEYCRAFKVGLLELQQSTNIKVYSCSSFSRLNNTILYCNTKEILR